MENGKIDRGHIKYSIKKEEEGRERKKLAYFAIISRREGGVEKLGR